jgi:hypothetical protein
VIGEGYLSHKGYEIMKDNNELDEKIQRCLNPNCGAVLFVSGKMGPNAKK